MFYTADQYEKKVFKSGFKIHSRTSIQAVVKTLTTPSEKLAAFPPTFCIWLKCNGRRNSANFSSPDETAGAGERIVLLKSREGLFVGGDWVLPGIFSRRRRFSWHRIDYIYVFFSF